MKVFENEEMKKVSDADTCETMSRGQERHSLTGWNQDHKVVTDTPTVDSVINLL